MKPKRVISYLFSLIILCFICGCNSHEKRVRFQQPTEGTQVKMDMEEGSKKIHRERWIQLMHQSAPEHDWQAIEYNNANRRFEKFSENINVEKSRNQSITFADGKITGSWKERGSLNQAGSVLITDYVPASDEIFTVSAGRSLWRGSPRGDDWKVVNDAFQFTNNYLKVWEIEGRRRIFAAIQNAPHYSNDNGLSWIKSQGLSVRDGANILDAVFTVEPDSIILILAKRDWWDDYKLYRSEDFGESFNPVQGFSTSDSRNLTMAKVQRSNSILIIEQLGENLSRLYTYDFSKKRLDIVRFQQEIGFGNSGRANLIGIDIESRIQLHLYNEDNELYKSVDTGKTWDFVSFLPSRPWSIGIYQLPSQPNVMLLGEVECYRSEDYGMNWSRLNAWWEYYDDIEFSLHADMMYFNEVVSKDSIPFLLISNHGGMSLSFDQGITNQNFSLENLNVSQYYSVRSNPFDNNWIFAGSQDQGFQRTFAENQEIANFEQVISGDYGHTVFTSNYNHLWTVYPGGWVTYYTDPFSGYYIDSWEVESNDESVWIPPLIPDPDPMLDVVYLAGGNINGDNGSHIIRLDATSGFIQATQFPFNFKNGGGEVSAMAFSPFNEQVIYVITTSGEFYISEDGGLDFQLEELNVPGSHYLYGACILPSKIDPNVIYISGSGYSNAPVLKSVNGGKSFFEFDIGMPPTLAYCLAANETEELIFAGTEAGPFVYIQAENSWFDLSQGFAPNQRYWSVEYLEASNIARFGTYGRGIWDFEIEDFTSSLENVENTTGIRVWPTLVRSEPINISLEGESLNFNRVIIYDLAGRLIISENLQKSFAPFQLDIHTIPPGMYILSLENSTQRFSTKFVKI